MNTTAAKSLQSRPTLCDPIDASPPGSTILGILQARTLEWVAISFSNAWKWKVKVKSFSQGRVLETPWTAAYQAPLSMGFSRQEYWSGLPLPSPSGPRKHLQTKTAWELEQSFPKIPLKSKIQQNDSSPSIKLFSELSLSTHPWFPKYQNFFPAASSPMVHPPREVIQIYASIYTSSCLLQKSGRVSQSLSLLD